MIDFLKPCLHTERLGHNKIAHMAENISANACEKEEENTVSPYS